MASESYSTALPGRPRASSGPPPNVGSAERWVSLALGVVAVWVTRRRAGALAWATRAVGSALLARGVTGRSEVYYALRVDTRRGAPPIGRSRSATAEAAEGDATSEDGAKPAPSRKPRARDAT